MRLFFKPAFALALLAMSFFACEQEKGALINPEEDATTILDATFSDYEIVTLDNAGILAESAAKRDAGFQLDLNIPSKPHWTFDVVYHDFYDPDFKTYESDANGDWVEVANSTARNDAFYGATPTSKSVHGMFIMLDGDLSGEIYDNDVQYGMNPLTEWVASARKDQYVLYRLDADVEGNKFECGADDEEYTSLKGDHAASEKMPTCREMSVNYIADYEMWNNKFGRNDTNLRNYIENRLKYGSYRYWGYNQYPLHWRLYTRYTRKNTRNRPMTSTNAETAVGQFKSWSNNSNNMRYADERLLFTGRNFGTLFGIAFNRAMCRRDNSGDNWLACGFVTKRDGISSAVYSKVTGHEVGHNLGAGHQDSGFMKQGNHTNRGMPTATRNQLNNHINNNNSCLSSVECTGYKG